MMIDRTQGCFRKSQVSDAHHSAPALCCTLFDMSSNFVPTRSWPLPPRNGGQISAHLVTRPPDSFHSNLNLTAHSTPPLQCLKLEWHALCPAAGHHCVPHRRPTCCAFHLSCNGPQPETRVSPCKMPRRVLGKGVFGFFERDRPATARALQLCNVMQVCAHRTALQIRQVCSYSQCDKGSIRFINAQRRCHAH